MTHPEDFIRRENLAVGHMKKNVLLSTMRHTAIKCLWRDYI